LTSALSVPPKATISELKGKCHCGNLKINPAHKKNGVTGYDFVVYINGENEQGDWLADAAPCVFDSETNRPVAGLLNFNMYYLQTLNLSNPVAWMDWVPSTTHEIIHALGFT